VTVIPDQLRWLAAHHPDEVAFEIASGACLTARDWQCRSSQLGRGFVSRGVVAGDRVVLLVAPEDGMQFVVAYAATHKAGAVAVPLNVRLTAPEVTRLLGHCEPRLVVVSPQLRALVPPAYPVLETGALASAYDDDASDLQVRRTADDLAEILYTSGTTGAPKGVAIEHGNSALQVYNEPTWSGQPWLHASPMSTFAGLAFVYQPIRMGMRTLYLPQFDPRAWLRVVAAAQPPMAFLVPAMVELLLAVPEEERAGCDLTSLQMVSVGSAPIAPATLLRLQELVPGATVSNSYSMTEAGTAYCVLPRGELARRPGSVGRPLPPAEIRVVDSGGERLPAGEMGHIVIRPAGKPRRYFRDDAASAALYRGEWLHTGDLGHFDADGYLYITGRDKDVIIRGGNNVHASDVEAVLYAHHDVQEAAVIGVPHPVLGEDVAAVVVRRAGSALTADELIDFAREQLADYKVPRVVEFRESLPRNATGKVLKRELKLAFAPVPLP
jgi:acyl-CoA synthetase (AMP-forming)/AMP-acid ligase II